MVNALGTRRSAPAILLATLAVSLVLWACGAEDPSTVDTGVTDAASVADGTGTDGGGPADAGGKGQPGDAAMADVAPITPSFELGTNVTGKNTRKFYSPVPEGAALTVELGPQGLWMVVLAFKTRAMVKPPLFLSGSIAVDGNDAAGKLALKKQKTILSDDGFDYYYNFWLVLKNDKLPLPSAPAGVAGKQATITLTVTDAVGFEHTLVRKVILKGGPQG